MANIVKVRSMNLGVVRRMKQFLMPVQMERDGVVNDLCDPIFDAFSDPIFDTFVDFPLNASATSVCDCNNSNCIDSSTSPRSAGGRKQRRILPRNAATIHE